MITTKIAYESFISETFTFFVDWRHAFWNEVLKRVVMGDARAGKPEVVKRPSRRRLHQRHL